MASLWLLAINKNALPLISQGTGQKDKQPIDGWPQGRLRSIWGWLEVKAVKAGRCNGFKSHMFWLSHICVRHRAVLSVYAARQSFSFQLWPSAKSLGDQRWICVMSCNDWKGQKLSCDHLLTLSLCVYHKSLPLSVLSPISAISRMFFMHCKKYLGPILY